MMRIKPRLSADKGPLARLGIAVRKRLAANPNIYRFETQKAEIFALGDFMNAEECAQIRAMIDPVARPSGYFPKPNGEESHRTSYSGDIDPQNPLVRKIQRRIDDLLGLPGDYGEAIQGQRYEPGQEFRAHYDWFRTDADYWKVEKERGGQRSWTVMVFLNPVEEGGMTEFSNLGLSIEPKQGVLLTWNNATPEGTPNKWTLHAALPVVKGVKYIITRWYRAGKWGRPE
jgi:prolyl 4-hydroxylase